MITIEQRQCQQCGSYYGRERDSYKGYGTYEFCPFCGSNNTIFLFAILPFEPRDLSLLEMIDYTELQRYKKTKVRL